MSAAARTFAEKIRKFVEGRVELEYLVEGGLLSIDIAILLGNTEQAKAGT